MSTPQTILALALALAPSTNAPASIAPLDAHEIEIEARPEATTLTAYDADGEVSAEFVLWTVPEGQVRLDATFPDGLYMSIIGTGEQVEVDSNDLEEVTRRLKAISPALADVSNVDVAWCAAGILGAAAACSSPVVLACMGAAAAAGIYCGTLISEASE